MFDLGEERLRKKTNNLKARGQKEESSKDIKHISKFRQRDEKGSGGNPDLTRVKFKDPVTRTEGRGYQRGLRTKR